MGLNYFREQKHYSLYDIQHKLSISEEKCSHILKILKRYGVVKSVDSKKPEYEDLSDLDVVLSDVTSSSDIAYKFDFVGVVLVENYVFCCYPKYIDDCEISGRLPEKELKEVLDVIQKYNSKEQLIHLYNGAEEDKSFNKLAVSLYLLNDYFDNGIYTNQKEIIETNGEGEINWDKTINETFAFIRKSKPYYVDLQTINTQSNELDYFKLLHECVLTICSNELKKSGLLELFDFTSVELSGQNLDDFGDLDYIKYRLENEIKNQFVTKKQILLKTIYAFISEIKSNENSPSFSLYGTNSFNLVWEKVCSEIFENIKNLKFKELTKKYPDIFKGKPIPNPDYDVRYTPSEVMFLSDDNVFKDLIENIKWIFNKKTLKSAKTLEPDIISIVNNSFFILDGKYYCNICESGIQDVVKQFAYHRAFVPFIEINDFETVNNAFLIPKKSSNLNRDEFTITGFANLYLMQFYNSKNLPPIQLVELEPSFVYQNYLKSGKCTEKLSMLVENLKKIEKQDSKGESMAANSTYDNTPNVPDSDGNNSEYSNKHNLRN